MQRSNVDSASRGQWSSPHADLRGYLLGGAVSTPGPTPNDEVARETIAAAWTGVYHRISSLVGDHHQAEELTQEVFSRVLARLGRGEAGSLKRAYLLQVAENLVRDKWRAEGRRNSETASYDRSSAASTPEEQLIKTEELLQLQDALGTLTRKQREVLFWRISRGLSVEETAAITELSSASVRQTQSRALHALRRRLAAHEDRLVLAVKRRPAV